jgi:MFS family permease
MPRADLGSEALNEDQTAAPAQDRASPYSWYVLSILVVVYILNFVDRQILSILANDIKRDLGLSDAYLGFLYGTAFAVFYALFGIPLGRLADSWSRVRLMSIGLALWSLMTAASGFAKGGAMLTGARVGVGVGEATASPAAYSLIADLFPRRMRATALAIYSSGLYLGGGFSILFGGEIADRWNAAWPGGGPLGLVGWQAAFIAVGLPGLLLALWVATIREPVRGAIDGIPSPSEPHPFKGFFVELLDLTPLGALLRGPRAVLLNLLAGSVIAATAYGLTLLTGPDNWLQWLFVAIGFYCVFSWASAIRERDPPTFALIWGTPAFLCTTLGYGMVAFIGYAAGYWSAPYAERTFGISKALIGWTVGAPAALAGFLGVILGGFLADRLQSRFANGRVMVVLLGLLATALPLFATYRAETFTSFAILSFITVMCYSSALGGAAAASQALVLPRMRGTATATFFIATTLVGLALGPFMAGYVSSVNDDNLAIGVLSTLVAVPVGTVLLILALRWFPAAAASLEARARAAGEPI